MKWLVFLALAGFVEAGPAKKPTPKTPSLAPACSLPGKSGTTNCPALGTPESRLIQDAKASDPPYTPPPPDRFGPRDLPCKITSDCPRGQFCSAGGICGTRLTN